MKAEQRCNLQHADLRKLQQFTQDVDRRDNDDRRDDPVFHPPVGPLSLLNVVVAVYRFLEPVCVVGVGCDHDQKIGDEHHVEKIEDQQDRLLAIQKLVCLDRVVDVHEERDQKQNHADRKAQKHRDLRITCQPDDEVFFYRAVVVIMLFAHHAP